MELKLNIYDNGEIIKTYTADKAFITTGTVEDILQAVDIDGLIDAKKDDETLNKEIMQKVFKNIGLIKPFLKDVFKDFKDEDFKKTSISEVLKCVMQIVVYSVNEFMQIGDDSKN
jgi:hypothetical protein